MLLSEESIIEKLALSYGIEPEYIDNWGSVHRTPVDTKKKILRAMGVLADDTSQAKGAWRSRLEGKWWRLAEPTIVANLYDLPRKLIFHVPVGPEEIRSEDLDVCLAITDEQDVTQSISYTQKDLSFSDSISLAGKVCYRWSLPFPQLDALGYYRFHLSVTTGGFHESQTISVAICPHKTYVPPALQEDGRTAGIAISLYGVRSERNWGIGDFGDLKKIVDWVSEDLHGGIIGLNPLHATFNRSPYNISPYLPISRFYRNFIYLDILALEDFRCSPDAQHLIETPDTQELLAEFRRSEKVQYEGVAALKEDVLRLTFQAFLKNHWNRQGEKTNRRKELEAYFQSEGQLLDDFATFSALETFMRSRNQNVWIWPQWPPEYHRPDTEAVRQFREEHWQEVLFYKYVQWQLEEQLAQVQDYAKTQGMCIGLYHDLALAIDRFGADFWAYQDYFVPNARVGAPPDAFSQHGQDWGFPPPNTERFRESGYDLFVKEIRKNCSFGGALRIDHVMRFFHLYYIPEGEPPGKGAYVSQPFEDLLMILALESVRSKVVIIGEDLGTVPPYIRKRLTEANVFSYRLLYFEKDDQQNFIRTTDYPELALVTAATHDLPTLAGFWTHRDIEIRKDAGMFENKQAIAGAAAERETDKEKLLRLLHEMGLLSVECGTDPKAYPEVTGEIHNAVVGFLALASAKLFVLSQEDLLKDDRQQNLPGTTNEYPNWSLKMKYGLEQLRMDPKARGFCEMFRTWIDRSGRKKVTQEISAARLP